MGENNIFKLLDLDPFDDEGREQVDSDAIIREAQRNPCCTDVMNTFSSTGRRCLPLHQAIMLRAPISVIDALCSPYALEARYLNDKPVLNFAIEHGASTSLVSFLLEKQPNAVRQKTRNDYTPLHSACRYKSSLEVVALLFDKWPDASKEKSILGHTPLHIACCYRASLEVVSMLLGGWSGAPTEKARSGSTPLHLACCYGSSFEVILLLLDKWLNSTENRNSACIDYLKYSNASEDTKRLLSHVSVLFNSEIEHPSAKEIMSFFSSIKWWKGVVLVLERYPNITQTHDLQTGVKADFLSTVGRHCQLKTMWSIVSNEQDLLAGVL
uniref:Uncharacterized protein n=1 Tax=Helicotheca tamesis TaxID=374047 RepID=A0A7S2GUR4_9STRA|mmetsp:Transcript_11911/g.16462  ORF Transcript_11911/g.16462 Transcript_11911/m.16462 type:complete len:326 (+) Transcript_11911:47-1024(+)